jgi:hypothetical protein
MEGLKGLNINSDPELKRLFEETDPADEVAIAQLSLRVLTTFQDTGVDYMEWHAETGSSEPQDTSSEEASGKNP